MGGQEDSGRDHFQVADVLVQRLRDRLTRGETSLCIEPKVMDLLVALARSPGEVRERGALIDEVWGPSLGRDESLTKAVSNLRHAFAELAPDTAFIETVPKRGYRLAAPVTPAPERPAPGRNPKDSPWVPARGSRRLRWIAGIALFVFGFVLGLLSYPHLASSPRAELSNGAAAKAVLHS